MLAPYLEFMVWLMTTFRPSVGRLTKLIWHFLIRLSNQRQLRDIVERYAQVYHHAGLYPPIPFESLRI